MNNQIINFYDIIKKDNKKNKKETINYENPNYNLNRMKHPFYSLVCGKGGAGKTNFVLNLLARFDDTYEKVIIYCKLNDEPLYEFLKSKLGDDCEIYNNLENLNVEELQKQITGQTLIIFDDMLKEDKTTIKENEKMYMFFRKINKVGCSLIFLSQSYYDAFKDIRLNLMYIILIG